MRRIVVALVTAIMLGGFMPATSASTAATGVEPVKTAVIRATAVPTAVALAIPSWVPSICRNYNGKNGKVICIGIKSWQLVALQNHKYYLSAMARHGAESGHRASDGTGPWPTRRGVFRISARYRDKVSTLYHVSMPYFMPFSGGQGIHFSGEYAYRGYRWSHGCVGLKSLARARQLFMWAERGTTVIVVNA